MSLDPASAARFVTVVCKVCGTRVDERLADQARDVRCPDCHKPVRIPGRSELPAPAAPPPPDDPGVYRLRDEAAASPRGRRARFNSLGDVLVVCPVCSARLHPPQRQESYRVRCPDCHRPVRVPTPEEAAARDERIKPRELKLPPVEALPVPSPAPVRPPSTFYSQQTAYIRREEEQPPPNWTWFTGVWGFPWQPEVVRKWAFLSLGMTMLGGLAALLTSLVGGAGGSPASAVIAFFALPAIWIFLWTGSYASSLWLNVITETAAGNQRIEDWPEQGWREGIFSMFSLLYLWVIALLIGHVLGLGSEALRGPYWMVLNTTIGLLLPYFALSMLETGAWYFPFSGPVTRSLGRNALDWLTCYLLLALTVGGFTHLWGLALMNSPVLTVLGSGWIWSAIVLISARLLGRLAWRITQTAPLDDEAW